MKYSKTANAGKRNKESAKKIGTFWFKIYDKRKTIINIKVRRE
jgi:hypothetical protein